MFFNSIDFAIFLPIVFAVYWLLKPFPLKWQNGWILIASYFFYGWWDWRFLILIALSTIVDFSVARAMSQTPERILRKRLLGVSLVVNIGMLGFFKYFNFFLDNFRTAFTWFGAEIELGLLSVVLPVGISFYTFQTLSYTIDVYRGKLNPTRDWLAFSAFVAFFPQLVAGPIERATNLLPQMERKRDFSYESAADGMRLILWGLFKKMVVADNSAGIVNQIFGSYEHQTGGVLVIGAVFFAFQIYGDFSGYSDIAIGTARLFGIQLQRNFHLPYFARDIAEFWRHWHISLTSWFRDYLYVPLGGSRAGLAISIRNTFVIFLVSGLWHGANWTFVFWGLFHTVLFLPLLLLKMNRKHLERTVNHKLLPSATEFFKMISTFLLVTIGWVFFRSESVQDAFAYLKGIFSFTEHYWDFSSLLNGSILLSNYTILFAVVGIFVLLASEWLQAHKMHAADLAGRKYRGALYLILALFVFIARGGSEAFIYFQF